MLELIQSLLTTREVDESRAMLEFQCGELSEAKSLEFLDLSYSHGLQPLLHHELRSKPSWSQLPSVLRNALSREANGQAIIELVRKKELCSVLEAFSEKKVR